MNEEVTIDGKPMTAHATTHTSGWLPLDGPAKSTVAALAAVSAAVGHVGKGDRNTQQGFNFRGIDAVVNAVAPAFRAHGIVAIPRVRSVEYDTVATNRGGTMAVVHGVVEYRFYGPDGNYVEAVVAAESFDAGDKATAKMMSVAYRTALLQVLTLPTDEPDPDAASFERGAPTPAGVDPTRRAHELVVEAKRLLLADTGNDKEAATALWSAVITDLGLTEPEGAWVTDDEDVAASIMRKVLAVIDPGGEE